MDAAYLNGFEPLLEWLDRAKVGRGCWMRKELD